MKDKKKTRKREKQYSKRYVPTSLSRKDADKQKKALQKARSSYKTKRGSKRYVARPKLQSFTSKKSGWTQKFHELYPDAKTMSQIAKVTGISMKALKAVKKKGMGAYYSSGSRPNQTAESWGKARMYSYILGGPTRKVDKHITDKYHVNFKHHLKK